MKAGKLLGLFLAAASLATVAAATEWKIVKQNGRDYVSFANLAEFYHFGEYSHANRTISLRSDRRGILAHAETNEIRINGVKFYTLYPLEMQNGESLISAVDVGKIVEPVLRPSRIKNAQKIETVVLDPGHGGTDDGTRNQWGSEKGFALDVAMIARDQLQRAGFKVEMTRSTDVGISLEERVEFANRFTNAVFVSIHFNAGTGGAGVESYALAPEGVPSTQSGGTTPRPRTRSPITATGRTVRTLPSPRRFTRRFFRGFPLTIAACATHVLRFCGISKCRPSCWKADF